MTTISIICCYNNPDELHRMLASSINSVLIYRGMKNKSDYKINTFYIDNTAHKYKSAAEAYNRTLEKYWDQLGEIVFFSHQDIAFDDDLFLKRIIAMMSENENRIIGVAGMNPGGSTISNLRYRGDGSYITQQRVHTPTCVASLDECLFAVSKSLLSTLKFDEMNCFHWHLYAVDMCYEAMRSFKTEVIVISESLYHKEYEHGLTCDKYFLRTMWKLIRKYRHDFQTIDTPCYHVSTRMLPAIIRLGKSYLKNIMI